MTHTKATAQALLPPADRAPRTAESLTRRTRVQPWAMWPPVDTLGEAFALAAIALVLAPLALLLARGCAAMHAARVLSPSTRAEEMTE